VKNVSVNITPSFQKPTLHAKVALIFITVLVLNIKLIDCRRFRKERLPTWLYISKVSYFMLCLSLKLER